MIRKLSTALKAARQLGLSQTALYARYQLGLRSGSYRRLTPLGGIPLPDGAALSNTGIRFPWREDVAAVLHPGGGEALLRQADEIGRGRVPLFGAEPVDLELVPPGDLGHWSAYHSGQYNGRDIKFTWEPGRFGWAVATQGLHLRGRGGRCS